MTARLSVQLYSVREHWSEDQAGTLARLAEIGFRHVEPFGLGNPDKPVGDRVAFAKRLRTDLDAAGLTVSGTHTALPENIADLAEECAALGADTAFVPHPRLVPGFDDGAFSDRGRVDEFAETLGNAAEEVAGHGLNLGYHNHWFEWADLGDGTTGYDRFWSRTSARLLAELDVYWAVTAGRDPARVMSPLGDRLAAVHLKDGPARQGEPQTPMGTGAVDLPAALAAVPETAWHVAEIDTTEGDSFRLLATNVEYLTRAAPALR